MIGVVFYPPFLVSTGTARLDDVVRHIDYIKNLVGVDYVALGSDFDGMDGACPVGLEDVSHFPAITAALLQKGYTRDDVRKILGQNSVPRLPNNLQVGLAFKTASRRFVVFAV